MSRVHCTKKKVSLIGCQAIQAEPFAFVCLLIYLRKADPLLPIFPPARSLTMEPRDCLKILQFDDELSRAALFLFDRNYSKLKFTITWPHIFAYIVIFFCGGKKKMSDGIQNLCGRNVQVTDAIESF